MSKIDELIREYMPEVSIKAIRPEDFELEDMAQALIDRRHSEFRRELQEYFREAIERAKPNSEMISTTTNKPDTIFGFDTGVRVFERSLIRELGLDND